ncbi:TraR/DksA C4-type zinc finger protein [Candidatus Falkowbacteria bacterium]|nr:TraR/DksA C4-type zinc finger protein [Candidatus Falkowbacteria bacterium]
MDKKTIEKIKKELLAQRKNILEELNKIADKGEYRAKFPELGDKPEENVQEIDEYTTNLATEKVLESALRDIDNALERIKKGTYGICKYCGKEIGEKRLMARLTASSCVECKSRLQKGG